MLCLVEVVVVVDENEMERREPTSKDSVRKDYAGGDILSLGSQDNMIARLLWYCPSSLEGVETRIWILEEVRLSSADESDI